MSKEVKLLGVVAGIALVIISSLFFLKFGQKSPSPETSQIDATEVSKYIQTVYQPNPEGLLCPEADGYCIVFVIDKADSDTFEVLGNGYAKDKNKVYYYGTEFSNDPENFKILDRFYTKDSKHVYGAGKVILNANPETFVVLKDSFYAKDNNSLFYGNEPNSVGVDIDSFTLLGDSPYAKDQYTVYYPYGDGFQILNEADPDTFKVISNMKSTSGEHAFIALDEHRVFIGNDIVDGVDSDTVVLIEGFYFKDKNNVFRYREKIPGADPITFEVIEGRYGKDANNIYMDTRIMAGVDVDTFEVIDHNNFKDKNHVYGSSGEIIENVDPLTIKVLSNTMYKDKNHVYGYHLNEVLPYDATTFEILKNCDEGRHGYPWGGCWVKDKNGVYNDGELVIGADPATFEILEGYYAKDKNNVFYGNKIIEGVDVKTFVHIYNGVAKDFARVYSAGKAVPDVDVLSVVSFDKTNYIKDKNQVFWNLGDGLLFVTGDISFKPIGNFYFLGKDANKVYVYGDPIDYVDADTFESIDNLYAKDHQNVYYIMEESFED